MMEKTSSVIFYIRYKYYCSLWKPVSFAERKLFPTLYRNSKASTFPIESSAERSSSVAIQTWLFFCFVGCFFYCEFNGLQKWEVMG